MESNEISMVMDVKLDIYEKSRFKSWTRCEVTVEAIKCLPGFLRITIQRAETDTESEPQAVLNVSVNVPGITISLATSRTKQHSYGIFWTQHRRNCFIYFALETESSCRRHMKWMRKSIKILELHRQVCLEQRRCSRDASMLHQPGTSDEVAAAYNNSQAQAKEKEVVPCALGPLPKLPVSIYENSSCNWSPLRLSRVSNVYEEIPERFAAEAENGADGQVRLSRRLSHASIASGIYEEMRPTALNFNAIVEETLEVLAPPLPPLPPPRKRFNTFETDVTETLGAIPRSNTNPESELAKKKKYKNAFLDIFGGGRSKRCESVSESQVCSVEQLIAATTPKHSKREPPTPLPTAGGAAKKQRKPTSAESKRNSFSSPDLSKINFLDTCDDVLVNSFSTSDDLELSGANFLDESVLLDETKSLLMTPADKTDSAESLNISQQLPNNFNFSACNTSTMNLIGSNGAVSMAMNSTMSTQKVPIDDLTGYCVMAPIKLKTETKTQSQTATAISNAATSTEHSSAIQPAAESTSSGYSTGTGSCASSTASCNNTNEDQANQPLPKVEECDVYENMLGSLNATTTTTATLDAPSVPDKQEKHIFKASEYAINDFTGNLYENLLAVKAAQELEQSKIPTHDEEHAVPLVLTPLTPVGEQHAEESYYQTPRKSIISVDEKIPSYYPNSCDIVKNRRRSDSSQTEAEVGAQTPNISANAKSPTGSSRQQQATSAKVRRTRKENLYIASPQRIESSTPTAMKTLKIKKTAAHKISENVYAVMHATLRGVNTNNNNNNVEQECASKAQETLQLALLQNIDFKFDDASVNTAGAGSASAGTQVYEQQPAEPERQLQAAQLQLCVAKRKEQCENAAANMSASCAGASASVSAAVSGMQRTKPQHHLQLSQTPNINGKNSSPLARQNVASATKAEMQAAGRVAGGAGNGADILSASVKKFASLPRFKKIDFSPLKLRINNVLQRSQQQQQDM